MGAAEVVVFDCRVVVERDGMLWALDAVLEGILGDKFFIGSRRGSEGARWRSKTGLRIPFLDDSCHGCKMGSGVIVACRGTIAGLGSAREASCSFKGPYLHTIRARDDFAN